MGSFGMILWIYYGACYDESAFLKVIWSLDSALFNIF